MRARLVAVEDVLAKLAACPRSTWAQTLRDRFPDDPALVRQGLIWLHAGEHADLRRAVPTLGPKGDRFDLEEPLDSGATASVWKAYDRKLGRHVAIKMFHRVESSMIRQSLAEARASSEVISEHVVRVYDVHDTDPPYIVLELVAEHEPDQPARVGTSAATTRPRDISEAVRWVRDIARGVHVAHLHDVFHRDLKPHNVLITPISRRAKIADFGLAIAATIANDVGTSPGLVLASKSGPAQITGTPEYMAPEQARGLPISLDTRRVEDRRTLVAVDVWGLGAIAYDLLSGTAPWHEQRGVAAWERAAHEPAPAPLERTADDEPIPKRLRKIVARALAPEPVDRYANAAEVADELDAYLARRATTFDRTLSVRFALWVRRNPHLSVTAAVAALCATMSLAAYVSVVGLRDRGSELAAEIQNVESEKTALATRVQKAHHALDETVTSLRIQSASLNVVRRKLARTQTEYEAIVTAKDHELQTANATTRQLADKLEKEHNDLTIAEKEQDLYEEYWTHARTEATQMTTERDAARHERDVARAEHDQALKERDAARFARTQAERDRDVARAELDRELARRRFETDVSNGSMPGTDKSGATASTPAVTQATQ